MAPREIWVFSFPWPHRTAAFAERVEAAGFDGLGVADSQNLAADPYIELALAAKGTERLLLATGVTNPYTRHPAVTAAAITTVQAESDGRAVLGIGRGDSSLAYLGLAPASPAWFERYLVRLQAYLRGDAVTFGEEAGDGLHPVEDLRLGTSPEESALRWLPAVGQPKVPVDVAATGPTVIGIAARHAERVSFAVGANPERVQWAVDTARQSGSAPSLGAWVNIAPHPDLDTARRLVAGGVSAFTRFSVMHGRATGPRSSQEREVLERVHDAYDMTHHGMAGSAQVGALTADLIDRDAVAGPVEHCVERLQAVLALGVERLLLVPGSADAGREEATRSFELLAREVVPALREASLA